MMTPEERARITAEAALLRECAAGLSPQRQGQLESGDAPATFAERVFGVAHRLDAICALARAGEGEG